MWGAPASGAGADQQLTVTSHTGLPAAVRGCWQDAEGRVYLDTDLGFGIVHSQDMLDAAQAVELGLWSLEPLVATDAPARFGYVREPAAGTPALH